MASPSPRHLDAPLVRVVSDSRVNPRFQAIVHGAVLALIVGWVLHVGRDVLVPLAFGVLVAYVIFGLTQLLLRVPVLGRRMPVQVRNAVSVLVISAGLVGIVF